MASVTAIKEKRFLFEQETINADFISNSVVVGDSTENYLVQLTWDNGTGPVDITVTLAGSADNVNFAPMTEYAVQLIDVDGIVTFDVGFSGAEFIRLEFTHVSGSIEGTALKTQKKLV